MEEHALRLMAQLGLIAVAIWVIASAMGKRNQVASTKAHHSSRMDRKSPVWNQSPVEAPSASSGLLFSGLGII